MSGTAALMLVLSEVALWLGFGHWLCFACAVGSFGRVQRPDGRRGAAELGLFCISADGRAVGVPGTGSVSGTAALMLVFPEVALRLRFGHWLCFACLRWVRSVECSGPAAAGANWV